MKIIVIAGPQASGKTTVWRFLKDKYGGRVRFYEEMNPYVLFPDQAGLGNLSVDEEMERRLYEADLERLKKIVGEGEVSVIETLMFHSVYHQELLGEEFYRRGIEGYKQALEGVEVGVLFIDTRPEISFARRRGEYKQRVWREIARRGLVGREARDWSEEMMRRYRQRMEERYQKWWQVLEELDYVDYKWVVRNNERSRGSLLQEVEEIFWRWL